MLDELNAPDVEGFAGHMRRDAETTNVSGTLHRAALLGATSATKASVEPAIGTCHTTVSLRGAAGRRRAALSFDSPRSRAGTHLTTQGEGEIMSELSIKRRNYGNVVILDVAGRITLGDDSIRLHDSIAAVIDTGSKKILVNLMGVEFIDTAGLGELVSASTMAARNGALLKLVHIPMQARGLPRMAEIRAVFETFASEVEAVRSFARGPMVSRSA
jgi:anti-sigma B factor antagonist